LAPTANDNREGEKRKLIPSMYSLKNNAVRPRRQQQMKHSSYQKIEKLPTVLVICITIRLEELEEER
jgi:hypothetical protein